MSYTATETLSGVTYKMYFSNGHTSAGTVKLKSITFPALNPEKYDANKLFEIGAELIDVIGPGYNSSETSKKYVVTGMYDED